MTARYHTLLLDCLRAERESCFGEKIAVNDRTPLSVNLPRAAGRVVPWAMGRAADVVQSFGRRPFVGGQAEPSAAERTILAIVDALGKGDEALAEMQAQWLVRPNGRGPLLRALGAAADALPT